MRRNLLLALLALALLFCAPAAYAASGKKAPKTATWSTIEEVSSDGNARLVYFGTNPDAFTGSRIHALTAETPGSATRTYKQTTYGVLGPLYSMYSTLGWKWDSGGHCTMLCRSGWGVIEWAGKMFLPKYPCEWTYEGLVQSSWAGNGTDFINSRYKGKFAFRNYYWPYNTGTAYSSIQVRGWRGGGSDSSSY